MDSLSTFSILVIIAFFLFHALFHFGKWLLKSIAWILLKTVHRPLLKKHEAEQKKIIEWLKDIGIDVCSDRDTKEPRNYMSIR